MANIEPGPASAAAGAVMPRLHADGYGPAGVATFAMAVEAGATITYEWQTNIIEASSGLEQRAACRAKPRQRYAFSSLLSDAQHRSVLSTLAGIAHTAPVFLLGLAHEAMTVVSSTGSTITVHSLAFCDWAVGGQRVVVVSPAGVTGGAVVQSAAGATLTIDADLTAIAIDGARVMPAMAVLLEPEQAMSRQRAGMGAWELAARAVLNGFAPGSTVGAGATVTTYDGLPVWDRGVAKQQAEQPLLTGAELVDLGGVISSLPSYTVSAWARAIAIKAGGGRARGEWQWLKKFLDTVQGRRAAFLLPTGRPDLAPVGDASSGTLTIVGPDAGGVNYVGSWFPSLAHRRLRIVLADGTAAYREVTACSNAGATQDLALDSGLAGAIARVEFLETVRLVSDEVSVQLGAGQFEATMSARVVQG